jgi:inhibitor of KinA
MLVVFGDRIDIDHARDILRFMAAARSEAFVRNLHPAYASVLVSFDPLVAAPSTVVDRLLTCWRRAQDIELPPERTVEIPVCYAPELGIDLEAVASHHGLSPDEIVRLHTSGSYRVRFLGFSPGFPYLSGLPAQLATPRLPTPRTHVPAGSVAIGGAQTGVYPLATPGGWRIIGRTPLRLFDPHRSPPALLQMGDHVTFRRISRAEFERS